MFAAQLKEDLGETHSHLASASPLLAPFISQPPLDLFWFAGVTDNQRFTLMRAQLQTKINSDRKKPDVTKETFL